MTIAKRDASIRLIAVLKLCGQVSTGPNGVFDQSCERIRAPISPPPERKSSARRGASSLSRASCISGFSYSLAAEAVARLEF